MGGLVARGEVEAKTGDVRKALDDFDRALAVTGVERNPYWIDKAKADRDRTIGALTTPQAPASTMLPPAPTPASSPPVAVAAPLGRRIALVIANGAYAEATLANPAKDADLVKASLERVGFSVTVQARPHGRWLRAGDRKLCERCERRGGCAVLFRRPRVFHRLGRASGESADGNRRRLPCQDRVWIGARRRAAGAPRGSDHRQRARDAGFHRRLPRHSGGRNPRPRGRGFAPISASAFEGAFVVISTREGKTTHDGVAGQGSPFARAFAEVLPTPKWRIEDVFYRIREKVRAETGDEVPDLIRSDLPEGGLMLAPAGPPNSRDASTALGVPSK